jgi:hypothetical protein
MSEAEARRALFAAAEAWAATKDVEAAFALVDAARAFAATPTAPAPTPQTKPKPEKAAAEKQKPGAAPVTAEDTPTIAFGAAKGTPLTQASAKSLAWYEAALAASVADPAKARWRARNEVLLAQVRAELARRG